MLSFGNRCTPSGPNWCLVWMDISAHVKVVVGTEGESTGYWDDFPKPYIPRMDVLRKHRAYHSPSWSGCWEIIAQMPIANGQMQNVTYFALTLHFNLVPLFKMKSFFLYYFYSDFLLSFCVSVSSGVGECCVLSHIFLKSLQHPLVMSTM